MLQICRSQTPEKFSLIFITDSFIKCYSYFSHSFHFSIGCHERLLVFAAWPLEDNSSRIMAQSYTANKSMHNFKCTFCNARCLQLNRLFDKHVKYWAREMYFVGVRYEFNWQHNRFWMEFGVWSALLRERGGILLFGWGWPRKCHKRLDQWSIWTKKCADGLCIGSTCHRWVNERDLNIFRRYFAQLNRVSKIKKPVEINH